MVSDAAEDLLIGQAVQGDRAALSTLLWMHYDRLAQTIHRKLPNDLRAVVDPEDIVQVVHMEVFRSIRRFVPQGDKAFPRWLATIGEQRLQDEIKKHRRQKRGGGHKRLGPKAGDASTAMGWLDVVARWEHTPSRSFSRRELEQAIQTALAGLDDDYREALRLRDLEGVAVAEIAKRMQRTERAIHNLCWRGRRQLRAAIGSASRFLS